MGHVTHGGFLYVYLERVYATSAYRFCIRIRGHSQIKIFIHHTVEIKIPDRSHNEINDASSIENETYISYKLVIEIINATHLL